MVPVFKDVLERCTAKNYQPVCLLSALSKIFEKLVNNRVVDHLEKCGLFLISSMVLGLLNQRQIFRQLYLIDLLGVLIGLGPLELLQLGISYTLDRFCGILVFFTNVKSYEFQVRYLALFCLFSVIDYFGWFSMGSLQKNILLMLVFLKAPFLVQTFPTMH